MDYYNQGYGQWNDGRLSQPTPVQEPAPGQQAPEELKEGMVIRSNPQFEAVAGDYNFRVESWRSGLFQPKSPTSKIPACKTADYVLAIPYRNDAGEVVYGRITYSLKLTPILTNVLAKFFEATGAVAEGTEFALDFNLPVGRTGVCQIEQRAGGNGGVYSSVCNVYKPSQRPYVTMNDGLPFDPYASAYGA